MPDFHETAEATAPRNTWSESELLHQAEVAMGLARQAGADDVVATVSRRRGVSFEWRDGRIEKAQEDASRALSVALYVDGRYSTHITHDFDPGRLASFLDEAVAITRHLEPDPHREIPDAKLYEGRSEEDLDLVDVGLASLGRDERIDLCRKLTDAASADASVVSSTSQVGDTYASMARVSSNGFSGTAASTAMVLGVMVTIREGETKRPEAAHFVAGTHQEDLPTAASVGAEALKRVLERRGAAKIDSAKTTMILHPEAGAMLFARALGAMSAGAVQQRQSFLAEKAGKPIASEILTVRDEPLIRRALASRHFDGEGIAARPRPILSKGKLETFYVDTYYGRKLGWAPTTGSPSNLVFEHGKQDLEQILSQIDDGILVTSWLGGNANLTTGDYSFGVRGHRIEGGKRSVPISEMNVTGNYLDLLGRVVEVGNDPVPWYACRTPTLVFDNIQFSGS